MKFSRRGAFWHYPLPRIIYCMYQRWYMASKYMKIKRDGKWTFVPIPEFRMEVKAKNLCECKRCNRWIRFGVTLVTVESAAVGGSMTKPTCKNRVRTTLKCRRSCCRKPGNFDAGADDTKQHQLSLTGSGDFCRLGCCDFSEKFAKHTCKKEQRS